MCGIAAIFNYASGEPINRAELEKVLTRQQRRGPDGSGEWFGLDGAVGLGHRRLSIIDLSQAGAQPMASADGRCVITFNGEIYNYRELRAELERKGCQFRSHSDTEVLLHLYQLEGAAMLAKLRGMFAFAIWDAARRGLFLARDPFGIKPLYYSDDGRTLRVASQVKALLAGGGIDTSPEPAGHVGFFLWGHVPSTYTLYRGIKNLAAGTSRWVDRSGNKRESVYSSISEVLVKAENIPLPSVNPRPMQEQLRAALSDSIRHHLIADVPVGVFLSSGLDSTTLTALAAENSATLSTVTLGFEEYKGTANDEVPLAEEVARHYRTKHQTIRVNKRDFRDQFPNVINAMDQPSCDGLNSYFVSLAAARAGLKVALSGLGGDELFGGYPSFREIPRAVTAMSPIRFCQPLGSAFRFVSAPFLKHMTSPKYAGLLEYGGSYGGAYLLRRGMFMPWELPGLLDADLVREGWRQLQCLPRLEQITAGLRTPYFKIAAMEVCWYMRHQLLRDTDWASMDHSIEVRTPLVDVELLQNIAPLFVAGPPPTKRDMALTPSSPLQASILNRPKTGFTVPVRQWLLDEDGDFHSERGLRGWTRMVYSSFISARGDSLHLTRASMRQTPPRRRANFSACRKILVFRIGQLGDTVVALPAMWALRQQFPDAELTLLCDRHPHKNYVFGPDLLRGSGLFQKFEFYPVRDEIVSPTVRASDKLRLLTRLRREHYDTLVYLSPSARSRLQIMRDRRFFRLAGIKNLIGMDGFAAEPQRVTGGELQEVPHEAEMLLARLAASGIAIPKTGTGSMDLKLGAAEDSEVCAWLKSMPGDGGRQWVAFGPGSKMPAKLWPTERFAEVGRALIKQYDIWPVVFGGPEDFEVAAQLLAYWGRGYSAAGRLSLRGATKALERCSLYIGNDTGTMHLAAAAGARCVAIFSAREWPGRWNPYGAGHHVLRVKIDCEGCGLVECVERKNECLQRITTEQVLAGCQAVLQDRAGSLAAAC